MEEAMEDQMLLERHYSLDDLSDLSSELNSFWNSFEAKLEKLNSVRCIEEIMETLARRMIDRQEFLDKNPHPDETNFFERFLLLS